MSHDEDFIDDESPRPLRTLTQGGPGREEKERIARDFQEFVTELKERKATALEQGKPLIPEDTRDEDWEEEIEHNILLEDDIDTDQEIDDDNEEWDDLDD